jgi:hypothetical protein
VTKSYQEILGEDASQYIPVIKKILSECGSYNYEFISEESFKDLAGRDIAESQVQYIKELLYRSHFASLSAIARNHEWLEGMRCSYEAGLYLPFAASMRCFLESTADSYFSLASLCTTISKNIGIINDTINKRTNEFGVFTDLENLLIHYSHARRVDKNETVPEFHKAETAAKYIRDLEEKSSARVQECYSELCQLSHPAAQGVLHMMVPVSDTKFAFEHGYGEAKIKALLSKYRRDFVSLLTFSFNPSILALKVLNNVDLSHLHVKPINELDMNHIVAWKQCKKNIEEARFKRAN